MHVNAALPFSSSGGRGADASLSAPLYILHWFRLLRAFASNRHRIFYAALFFRLRYYFLKREWIWKMSGDLEFGNQIKMSLELPEPMVHSASNNYATIIGVTKISNWACKVLHDNNYHAERFF